MDDVGTRSIFTPEQDMFRESVRKFMQDTLAPQQEAFEKAGEPTREAWKAMGAQGLIGVSTPAEVGGIGGTFIDEMIVCEEMSYSFVAAPAMGLHSAIVMPYLTHYGTKDQQEKYLPAMTAGECIASIGMTEPDAGSDLQGIRTTAKRDGDDWIINGSKIYITNGWLATRALSTSTTARQQPRFSEDGSEQVFRPSNVQSKRMDDVGTRSIFTPEQDMFRESVRKFMQDTLAPQQEAAEAGAEGAGHC